MKKLILIILSLALSLALIACNSTTPPENIPDDPPAGTETPPEDTTPEQPDTFQDIELPRDEFN